MSLIDLTPMIDILFTVLLFFMLTQNVPYNSFNLNIPKTQKEQGGVTVDDAIKVHIFPNNSFLAINSKKLSSVEEFRKEMQFHKNTSSVMLIVDGETASKNLISVMEILNELQFSKINVITKYE
jgi:biopolymer transport protein ExbD